MKRHRRTYWWSAHSLALLLAMPVLAQVKDPAQVGVRSGPPVFGGLPPGFTCSEPGTAIPDNNGTGISSIIVIENNAMPVSNLQVAIQINHTWVGDLRARLAPRIIIDRPGWPLTPFGCAGDDIDVILNDLGVVSVENWCAPTTPAIGGVLQPSPEGLGGFNGSPSSATWTLQVTDHAAGDVGSLEAWCINLVSGPPGPTTTGGTTTPATSAWSMALLIAMFLGVGIYYLHRQSRAPR